MRTFTPPHLPAAKTAQFACLPGALTHTHAFYLLIRLISLARLAPKIAAVTVPTMPWSEGAYKTAHGMKLMKAYAYRGILN